jgi:zinc transport system substrate-binding protein
MQLTSFFRQSLWAMCLLVMAGSVQAASLPVLVSILPQKYFVERIGGGHVDVSVLVGPGRSPENYEPTMQQLAQVAEARLFWRMGLPFEEVLASRLFAQAQQVTVLDARQGVRLRDMESLAVVLQAGESHGEDAHGHEHEHEHQGKDPHFWLSPRIAMHMAGQLKRALQAIDPGNAQAYEASYQALAGELTQLDADIQALLANLTQRRFMVFHPAWGYFADAYELRQIPIEIEGKSPGPRTLAAIIQLAREENIRVVFVQSQFSRRDALTVAQAIGGVVVAVDPLAENYSDNLRQAAQAFARAMQ